MGWNNTIISFWFIKTYKFKCIPVRLPWIFAGTPFKVNGAPRYIQGNLTGMQVQFPWGGQSSNLIGCGKNISRTIAKGPIRFTFHVFSIVCKR